MTLEKPPARQCLQPRRGVRWESGLSLGIELLVEEFFHCNRVSERFRAPVPRRRKGPGDARQAEAFFAPRAREELGDESRIETVCRSERIHHFYTDSRAAPLLPALASDCTPSTELKRNDPGKHGELLEGFGKFIAARNGAGLTLAQRVGSCASRRHGKPIHGFADSSLFRAVLSVLAMAQTTRRRAWVS
jgi:hypothetical protein